MKNKISLKFLIIIIGVSAIMQIISCKSKSLEDKCNRTTYVADIQNFSDKKMLSDSDKIILSSYLVSKMNDSITLTKSYSVLLSEAKADYNVKKEIEEKKKALNTKVTITVLKKYMDNTMSDGSGDNILALLVGFKNNTERDINAISFTLSFTNAENSLIYEGTWNVPTTIKAKTEFHLVISFGKFDNNDDDLVRLRAADLSKIKTSYQITKLIFDDGTSISVE